MITADNISVSFSQGLLKKKSTKALNSFSFSVKKGEAYALIGPNGAGKSTAFYCLLGLIRPDTGSVSILGHKPDPGGNMFEKVAFLPEEPIYHDFLTVRQLMEFYGSFYSNTPSASRIKEVIEIVQLSGSEDIPISKCSKGMRQKAGIAACLLNNPQILLLDEPTRGLDPLVIREFRTVLKSINSQGTTILLNSHELSEIEMFCSNVAILNKGTVIHQSSIQELIRKFSPGNSYRIIADDTYDFPDYFEKQSSKNGFCEGEVKKEQLYSFWDFARINKLTIVECSLKKLSLEEAFITILEEKNNDKKNIL